MYSVLECVINFVRTAGVIHYSSVLGRQVRIRIAG